MLSIGQIVYTVCKMMLSPYRPPAKYKYCVSEKEVNGIMKTDSGDIIYTAGPDRELQFKEVEPGKYESIENENQQVYLDIEDANLMQYILETSGEKILVEV